MIMNWGKWIVVAFIVFAVFIGVLVTVCVRQDVNLVSKNYYVEELAYQQQIERINNTLQLEERPRFRVVDHKIEIQFSQFEILEKGELKLFRPSDVRLDRHFVLHASTEIIQQFDAKTFATGMYRLKMQWSMKGKEYYIEEAITL